MRSLEERKRTEREEEEEEEVSETKSNHGKGIIADENKKEDRKE